MNQEIYVEGYVFYSFAKNVKREKRSSQNNLEEAKNKADIPEEKYILPEKKLLMN